jgi:proline dehydrogenase
LNRRRALFRLATSRTFERAARPLPGVYGRARRYVAGETLDDAIALARRLDAAGLGASIDLFGERTGAEAAPAVARAYMDLCARLAAETPARTWVSLDLSHIAFDAALLDRVAAAIPAGRRLQIGAEQAASTDRILDAVLTCHARGRPVEATLQANLRRSVADADRLAAAGVPVRLVKGAYVEDAVAAHAWGEATDRAYTELARRLHGALADVALATHHPALRTALPHARCEVLLGVRPADAAALAAAGRDTRVYVPYGDDWFRYFMRRRAEAQGA